MPICMVDRETARVALQVEGDAGDASLRAGEVLQPRLARRDQRHLRHREDRVEQHEKAKDSDLQRQHLGNRL
jgi:hypothetical protein